MAFECASDNVDLFTIKIHYTNDDVNNVDKYKLTRYIDFCCADQISRLEMFEMAKELKVGGDGISFWWFDYSKNKYMLSKIKSNSDALSMALSVGMFRVMDLYVKVSTLVEEGNTSLNVDESVQGQREHGLLGGKEVVTEEATLLEEGTKEDVQSEMGDEVASGMYDSDYSFDEEGVED